MRQLLPLALSLTLIGCATSKVDVRNEAEAARYDPVTSARVRLITGDNAHGAYFNGQSCEKFMNETFKGGSPEESGWKMAHSDSSGIYPFRDSDHRNSVVGMPASQTSRNINSTTKQFDEYVVQANKPFLAVFGMVGSIACSPKPVSFIPQPGQDYEMQLKIVKLSTFSAGCIVELNKLSVVGNNTLETPVPKQFCAKGADGAFHTMAPGNSGELAH